MRSVIGLLVGLCTLLGVAGTADAGFGVPHGTEVCGSTNLLPTLPDPSTAYADIGTPALCAKLCKQTEATCRATVKEGFKCVLRVVKFNARFTKIYCDSEFDGEAERDCKENAEAFYLDDIPAIKVNRLARLTDCAQWGDACRANSCD